MISPSSSADKNSTFFVSNRSKQVLRHLISSGAKGFRPTEEELKELLLEIDEDGSGGR